MSGIIFRPLILTDHDLVLQKIIVSWGSEIVVAHGQIFRPAQLPGFGAFVGQVITGLLTYHIADNSCEVITLNSWNEGMGIGTRLIEEAKQIADIASCVRMWLITTNDNTPALRFYQKCGFLISGIRINAMESARRIKPQIPMTGVDGIPLRDEIELELIL
jgi:ribosomal protein S18 acetylase RimI-like enzyme